MSHVTCNIVRDGIMSRRCNNVLVRGLISGPAAISCGLVLDIFYHYQVRALYGTMVKWLLDLGANKTKWTGDWSGYLLDCYDLTTRLYRKKIEWALTSKQ